jgi:hypothetical protein
MGSISPGSGGKLAQRLAGIARETAVALKLPWDLQELKKAAYEGAREATEDRSVRGHADSLGLSRDEAEEHFALRRAEEVGKKRVRERSAEEQPTWPSNKQIEVALGAFAPDHWKAFAKSFCVEEANEVCHFLDHDDNRSRLIASFGSEKVYAALGAAALRAIELERADDSLKTVAVTDPYWAVLWWEQASLENRRGAGHPSKGRSLMESVSKRRVAKRLSRGDKKASAYEIRQWRERAKRLSFKQYVADKGYDGEEHRTAAFIEYWATIHNTAAFKTHSRAHDRREK